MKDNQVENFKNERTERIKKLGNDKDFKELSNKWLEESMKKSYVYNFSWLGRPIIQNPIDIVATQEIIWTVQPDLIIETGIAHGGSLILSASLLELNAVCGGPQNAKVLGVDIDIRDHNKAEIEAHPLSKRISMIQGSSTAPEIISQVKTEADSMQRVLVMLDSNHTHEHVLAELEAYAPLTSVGSYCVVFDTFVEDVSEEVFPDRPWGPGDNPKTAVWEYLKQNTEFEIDNQIDDKLLITVAPDGFLKRVR